MKKIFFNGKVHDHNKKHSLYDIQQEIQTELDNEYGTGRLCMQISIPNKNEYQFLLYRSFANNIKPGMTAFDHQTIYMFDFDMFLGNDPSSQGRPFSFMMNYYENVDTFEKQYKQKAVKAGGNRPKSVKVEDDDACIKVTVQY
jgi:cyclophilin family peptidyl-prolyl cis-trans isomerase